MRISRPWPIAIGISLLLLLPGVAGATSTTCATSTVCAEYINSSSGVAIHGEANNGIGIRGTSNTSTGFYGASRSGSLLFPGVEGESLNPGDDDAAGAFGFASLFGNGAPRPPAYGVVAAGSLLGVDGLVANNDTVDSTNDVVGAGVYGGDDGNSHGSDPNAGVLGFSPIGGTGVLGLAKGETSDDYSIDFPLFGSFPIGVLGDAEPSQSSSPALGVVAVSNSIPLYAFNPTSNISAEAANARLAFEVAYSPKNASTYDIYTLDNSGNINAASLTTTQGTYARTTGTSGTARTLYTPHTSSPVTEDFGEGQLVNGRGYVRLDPALADVIDERHAYHVFLTPEGESNELYVTQKSQAGFVVREAHGGRSTLAFEYRILAKPVDENGVRLAVAPPLPRADTLLPRPRPHRSSGRPPLPLDPFDRLKLKLGPAGYARALAAARQNQIGR